MSSRNTPGLSRWEARSWASLVTIVANGMRCEYRLVADEEERVAVRLECLAAVERALERHKQSLQGSMPPIADSKPANAGQRNRPACAGLS